MTHAPDAHATPPLLRWLAALGDMARLRLLRLLAAEELGVGELSRALQMPQSTVSRHLRLLHEAQWIVRRSEGTAGLYRLDEQALSLEARALWSVTRGLLTGATFEEDRRRMREVVAQRTPDSRSFFGRIGGDWDRLRRELFGESFTAEALLGLIDPGRTVADLGCGTGPAAELLAPVVGRVIAIDREPAMLEAARRRLRGRRNVEFRQGELSALPVADAEVDAAIVLLVMVYLPDPQPALREMFRVLRPGGVGLIVDLIRHDRESYRYTLGHEHLGFDERQVRRWAGAAGFCDVAWRALRPDPDVKGPGLFAATMRR
jgi:ArsR family transcriptional regulator